MGNAIFLPRELNINAVNNFLEQVKNAAAAEDRIVLDASELVEMDALGLQLLLSIEKTAAMNGISFEVVNMKDEIRRFMPNS